MKMNSQDSDDLLRVAEAISDGTKVNWHDASLARASLRSRLERLRIVEKIRAVHRMPVTQPARTPPTPFMPLAGGDVDRVVPDDHPLPPSAPETWGSLQILERIGGGGSGEVFRAHDPALQKDVALKLRYACSELDAAGNAEENFLDEGRRLASVRHENVLTVHGAARHDGRVGLWTDLVEGQTLEQCLALQGPMGPKEASVIGMDLCRALAAVHQAQMVHGDVKASNVMREAGSGKIILMDFSSARERRSGVGDTWSIGGTPIYMAPELLRGRDAGVTSDIYSLGVLLYRLVTERFPIEAGSIRELRDKMSRGETLPMREVRPDLPRRFIQVVERALAIDPADRYHGVADMERDLARALEPRRTVPPRITLWQFTAVGAAIGLFLIFRIFFQPFSVDASVQRTGGLSSQVLAEGAMISPGDELFLEIESNKKMHVYVINLSDGGQDSVLFPVKDLEVQNPLPAGKHRLPGVVDGIKHHWPVDGPGRQETFLVVASLSPLEELERSMQKMRQVLALDVKPPVEIHRRSITTHRPSAASKDTQRLIEMLAAGDGRNNKGVWVWQRRLSKTKSE